MGNFQLRKIAGPTSVAPEKATALVDVSAEAQRQRVLTLLMDHSRSTFELRDAYNVLMPAARVKELKELGHEIHRTLSTLPDSEGRLHPRIATYALIKLAEGEGAV